MDANEKLNNIRVLVEHMEADYANDMDYNPVFVTDLWRAVMALDTHLTNGGTLPDAWNPAQRATSLSAGTETNAEGLTWEEWRNAAQAFGAIETVFWRIAWDRGEDPTEYANKP